MATPNRSIRLSDEAMDFLNGLAAVYGSPDKGILAIAGILTPEAIAAHAESLDETVELTKPVLIDSLRDVIQHVPSVIQATEPIKPRARAESVAQRKQREQREHAAALAESDVAARLVGRDDIEYDLDNVAHRSVPIHTNRQPSRPAAHYDVQPRAATPLTRPHGQVVAKRRREQ